MAALGLVNLSGLMDNAKRFAFVRQLRRSLVAKAPAVELTGEVGPWQGFRSRVHTGTEVELDARTSSGIDEVYVVAGHKGQPDKAAKRGGAHGAASWQARRAAACWRGTSRQSLA